MELGCPYAIKNSRRDDNTSTWLSVQIHILTSTTTDCLDPDTVGINGINMEAKREVQRRRSI